MSIVGPELEDDLNFWRMEEDLKFFGKWKRTSIFWKMEDDLNFGENERRTKFKRKWKTASILK
jgi:hypothetical protein